MPVEGVGYVLLLQKDFVFLTLLSDFFIFLFFIYQQMHNYITKVYITTWAG